MAGRPSWILVVALLAGMIVSPAVAKGLGDDLGDFGDDFDEDFGKDLDADLGKGLLVDADYLAGLSEEEREALAYLGNAGEAADLTNVGLEDVKLDPKHKKDLSLLLKFAEARGAGADTLDDL